MGILEGNFEFRRLRDQMPNVSLWGNNNITWHDVIQGMASNCYIHSAMGAIAEFPELVKSVFLTDTNDAGIYAVRFFIRGKPWVVTIDDDMLF